MREIRIMVISRGGGGEMERAQGNLTEARSVLPLDLGGSYRGGVCLDKTSPSRTLKISSLNALYV